MRTLSASFVALALVACCASSSFGLLAGTEYFNLAGYNHALVSGAGQTFNNVNGAGLNVTVRALGTFDGPTSFVQGSIRAFHADPGSYTFQFIFNQAIRAVVKTETVDINEAMSIFSVIPDVGETYFHDFGAAPTVTPDGTGIRIRGNGFGISATGAARGETLMSADVTRVHVQYSALATVNKFDRIMIGRLVPEPNAIGLLGSSIAMWALQFRKRRSTR